MQLSRFLALALALAIATPALAAPKTQAQATRKPKSLELIRSDYQPGEITKLCDAAMEKTAAKLDAIGKLPPAERNAQNTLIAMEDALSEFWEEGGPLQFMASVSPVEALNKEGAQCKEKMGQFGVEVSTRRDLFEAIQNQPTRSAAEARLMEETIKEFELNGLKLPAEQLEKVKKLFSELSTLSVQFSTALNEDKSFVAFSTEELEGVPETALARFKKQEDGKYIVTTKSTDYSAVIENAKRSETRRRIALAYQTRGGEGNVKLLERALLLRQEVAKLLGFATWADYKTSKNMAKTGGAALSFLEGLKGKLASRNRSDLDRLLRFKKELEPGAQKLDAWDTGYLAYQLQKRDFSLDNEKIREYFPADLVVAGMFKTYAKLLGVRFEPIPDARVWAEGVKLYAIYNQNGREPIAHFYTDFFPRQGKYGHAAAFTLRSGRKLPDGSYQTPISAIVSNFTPPADGKPSLLTHNQVSTAFHEFGHIMHQTLTLAPYASLSGTQVARDFVEAPSQMLENWAWSPAILAEVSGHYKTKQKLPAKLLRQMLAARDFNQGVFYTRQLLLGLFDLKVHTTPGPVKANETYEQLYREIAGLEPMSGGSFPGTFGHIMGGYDASYYGYIWSEVFADDMFSKFTDLTSPRTGMRYRRTILEQGGMKEPQDLLKEFLGREPRPNAFFKRLKI